MKKIWIFVALLALSNVAAAPQPSTQYAAKFVCGKLDGPVVARDLFHRDQRPQPRQQARSNPQKVAVALPGERLGPSRNSSRPGLSPTKHSSRLPPYRPAVRAQREQTSLSRQSRTEVFAAV